MTFRASRRRLLAAAGLPLLAQSVLFQVALASGLLYRTPTDSVVETTESTVTVYYDYGLFGPYFGMDLALFASVGAAVIVAIAAVGVVEYRARRGAGAQPEPAGAAA